MVAGLQAEPATTLAGFGAVGPQVDELLRYNENVFRIDRQQAAPRLPLPDEPFVAFWRRCAAAASELGSLPVLRGKLPQLRFPIRAGIGDSDPYHAATRRGVPPDLLPAATGLPLREPERLEIVLHPSAAGTIPLLVSRCREDFVSLVQALARRNEPWPVPAAMGALMVSGYHNWERFRELRRSWEAAPPARRETATWAAEMARLRQHQELYHDRFILLSDGPYSAVPAAEVGLDDAAWRELSLAIRREHECTHYFTRRLFGAMRNNLLDELIADYVGVTAAMGRLRPDWLLRFLGLEELPRHRAGGRIEIYRGTPPLSDGAWAVLLHLARAAVANLARFDAARQPDLRSARGRALVIAALASLRLEDLAGGAPALLEATYDRVLAWAGGPRPAVRGGAGGAASA